MKKILVYCAVLVGIILIALKIANEWWNLWVYRGWFGPPGWQWLIMVLNADGEIAYEVVMIEMFLVILLVIISTVVLTIRFLKSLS